MEDVRRKSVTTANKILVESIKDLFKTLRDDSRVTTEVKTKSCKAGGATGSKDHKGEYGKNLEDYTLLDL